MRKIYILSATLFIFVLVISTSHAQTRSAYREKVNAELSKLDLSGIKNGIFVNLSIFNPAELDQFRNLKPNQGRTHSNAENWENLYERLSRAQLKENFKTFPEFATLTGTTPQNRTKNNTIPIGILDVEGTLLTEQQVKNAEQKKNSLQNSNSEEYEKIQFLSASVLQERVYQSEVEFRIGNDLLITNRQSSIQEIEIDFGDGNGFKKYKIENQLINHKFTKLGKNPVKIKLLTPQGSYLFESTVNVVQFDRRKPYREFQVTASPIVYDTVTYRAGTNKRTAAVPGANVRTLLGCDGVFNKPLLLVEGIDLGEDVNLDDLEADWVGGGVPPLQSYLNEGYDIVLLDWQNSHDFIQNNAQVLKAVINEINQTKVGTNQIVVIATSMGGLVSRWALREMENASQLHHVSHLICHDTPHQGANIPIGLTQLYWETPTDVMENLVIFALNRYWSNYYHALQGPSSRQMLLHWGGQPNVGVGNKHPDFDNFRTALAALGNGGYPSTCRNVAIVNGSMDASDRSTFNDFNYGDRIVLGWIPGFRRNTFFDIHTNALSQNNQIMRVTVLQIPPKFPTFLLKNINFNNALNDDFLPGGMSSVNDRVIEFLSDKTFEFAFVPTFSSIDFQGPRTTQTQREMLSVTAVNAVTGPGRQTPFAAIYGRNANSFHAGKSLLNWRNLGFAEGLLTNSGCPAASPPPAPQISLSTSNCLPFSDYRQSHGFDVTVNIAATGQSYRQVLTIEKLGTEGQQEAYVMGGQTSFTFQVYELGQYRITCTRSYPGRPDLISTANAVFNASDCNPPTFAAIPAAPLLVNRDCAGFWENDYLVTFQDDTTKHVFAHITPGNNKLYASIGDDLTGAFVNPATLETYGLFSEFAECFSPTDPRGPLPVTLQDFNVHAEGKTAQITWRTTSEINSERFDIERSHTGRDWQKIGDVATEDAGIRDTDYTFVDIEPGSNLVYYRLKMVDTDGTFAYSKIETVRFGDSGIIVYPNPVEGGKQLQLLLNNSKVEKIFIYDLSGKSVYEGQGPIEMVNTKNLMNGRYVLKIRLKDGSESSHTILKR